MNTRTQEIDLLMKKAELTMEVADEMFARAKKILNLKKGEKVPKHFIRFHYPKSRAMTEGELFGHKLITTTTEFDRDLFDLMRIEFGYFWKKHGKHAGYYARHRIMINHNQSGAANTAIDKKTKDRKFFESVIYHEIGHAWHYQLSGLAKVDMREMALKSLKNFLQNYFPNIQTMDSFNELHPFIVEELGNYAGKNYLEAFAELFKCSCHSDDYIKKARAKRAIKNFNDEIKCKLKMPN